MPSMLSECDELTPVQLGTPDVMPSAAPAIVRRACRLEPQYEDFLGMTAVVASPAMRRLLATAAKIARTDWPVLITGESGTGKELISRAVHHYSKRSAKPFIDINCAALPEHLIESELFGYERGAFSGADTSKPGLFETAHLGTLFLDEIGELDTRMQAKLLRVLDGQPYFRLGGSRKITVDVRIVAATNIGLDDALASGKFRSDLFHRLDAYHLHVPPLRDRVEDIAALASHFLEELNLKLSPEALSMMEEYSWPGNIRELRNALNKAALFASGSQIEAGDLPMQVAMGQRGQSADNYSLDGLEQQTIRRVLAQTGGHQQRAADLLGISRRTLIRKLKLYRSPENQSGKRSQQEDSARNVA